jgi:hypothetical protein
MKNYFEIQFWKIAKWIIKRGYGADCKDFFSECASCQAKGAIHWIDQHIDLLKWSIEQDK